MKFANPGEDPGGKTQNKTAQSGEAGRTSNQPGAGKVKGRRVDRIICLFLGALTLAVFGQTLKFDFVNFDDQENVYENREVARGLTMQGLADAFKHGSPANWDPLTTLSHMLDCQIWGLRPGGHHLTNVLLHTASVILLFLVLRRMTGARWQSAFVAAIFAIHPLRAESVAWITERKDVLSGLFFMLTLWAYARHARGPWRWSNYLLVVLLFVLGLMSKAMLVTLPVVLLLLDYWPLKRFEQAAAGHSAVRRLWLEKIPLLMLSAGSCVVTLLAQNSKSAFQSMERIPVGLRAANAVDSVVIYARDLLFPTGLAAYYPYPLHGLPFARVLLALLMVIGISAAAWCWRVKRPYLLTGWLWNLVMLAPVIGIIQVGAQARADRYTYLPQIGLSVALVWLLASLWPLARWRNAFFATAGGAAIVALSACAYRQTATWRDSMHLWEHCLASTSGNWLAHNNLAGLLFRQGRYDDVITQERKALEVAPREPSVHLNLGRALFQKNLTNEAIAEFETALALAPDSVNVETMLGYALLKSGRSDDAIGHFDRALRLQPQNLLAMYNLGTAYLQKGQTNDAIRTFKAVLGIQRNFEPAQKSLNDLAWSMATSPVSTERNGDVALDLANGLVELTQGKQPLFLRTLAAAFAEKGRFADATGAAEAALQLAQQANDSALAAQLQRQLAAYRANQPYRDSNPAQPDPPRSAVANPPAAN